MNREENNNGSLQIPKSITEVEREYGYKDFYLFLKDAYDREVIIHPNSVRGAIPINDTISSVILDNGIIVTCKGSPSEIMEIAQNRLKETKKATEDMQVDMHIEAKKLEARIINKLQRLPKIAR
jgi:hypothetical protein